MLKLELIFHIYKDAPMANFYGAANEHSSSLLCHINFVSTFAAHELPRIQRLAAAHGWMVTIEDKINN